MFEPITRRWSSERVERSARSISDERGGFWADRFHLPQWTFSRPVRLLAGWIVHFWSIILVCVLGLGLVIAAIAMPGTKAADLHLHDGTVYVPSRVRGLIGALNYEIDELATAAPVGSNQFKILQDQRTVLVYAQPSNQLQRYDPITNTLSAPVTVPSNALLSLGNGVLSVTNPNSGKVWYGDVDAMLKTDFQRAKAQMDIGEFGRAIVTSKGNVIGVNVKKNQVIRPDDNANPVVDLPFELDPSSVNATELSAVGEKAVVLNRTGQVIWAEGAKQPTTITSGSTAFLAPPAPSVDAGGQEAKAIYATQAGLNVLTGRGVRSLSGLLNDKTIAPLVVDNCAYGANGGRVVSVCDGGSPKIQDIPQLPDDADLAWVSNRGNVVLVDQQSGTSWLVNKGMKIVNNWERVSPTDKTVNNGDQHSDETIPPDRTKPNRPPIAEDDLTLGARAGRSTTLPILDNDADPDGDILSIEPPPEVKGATLQLTGDGSGMQITLPSDASGVYSFTYTVTDGRGGSDTARVQVKAQPVDPTAANQRPFNQRPAEVFEVALGSTSTKRVLLNWRDPDGDDLVLSNAWLEEGSEDEVRFTPDGTITFIDVGKKQGAKKIFVSVSDGVHSTDGVLLVDTVKKGVVPPKANGDFVTVTANQTVVIDPLSNDEGSNLSLRSVDSEGGDVIITPNFNEGKFSFRAPNPGTYYVMYRVSNGPVATGLVRINVISQTGENHSPVAARDIALLPFGGSVVIDPLQNDTDPDNDVLVVQTVQSSDPSVQIVMEERRLLTISATRMPNAPVTLTYWVSDGNASAKGTISVIPSPSRGTQRPRAVTDEVKVRAGSTVTVPVLQNDTSPLGLPLRLKRLVENPLGNNAWVDGDKVRIAVPANASTTTMTLTYQVEDTLENVDSASVNVTVISADAENEAPRPIATEARVLSNSTTRIPIKLDGIDPNGDAVRLLGLGSGPRLGRMISTGDGWFTYEAYADSRGTDTFHYQVVDALGAVGTGEIRVGIAPPSVDNAKPTAVRDELTVRPGRMVSLPVLRNDFDIDGDTFGFEDVPDKVTMPFEAKVGETKHVEMKAPTQVGEYAGNYRIVDVRGAKGVGNISLNVREDAPLQPPVAVDDQVSISEVLGKEWISVNVLENDYDLDGPRENLKLSVPKQADPSAESRASIHGTELRVSVADTMQQIRYQLTDSDGNVSYAIVQVPGRGDSAPALKELGYAPTVIAGQQMQIDLNTLVAGTQGRKVKLTSIDTVRATKGVVTVPGEDRLIFVADVHYSGPASVVFEVIDIAPGAERSAKKAYVSIPITVKPAPDVKRDDNQGSNANRAPVGPEEVTLEVGAGDPESSVNIRPLFTDPENDNFEFEEWKVENNNTQIHWRADVGNSVVLATADVKARGATMTLTGKVFDAYSASRTVRVVIKVVGSVRPLPQAEPDIVSDANAGETRLVDALANDRSNLVSDQSLTLLEAQVISGQGTADVRNNRVAVTPGVDYVGSMIVRYRMVDATGDPSRAVDGQIRLTVRSRPAMPGVPVAEAVGNHFVRLKWTSGDDNGEPVIRAKLIARSELGDTLIKNDCQANLCTFDGLTNGVNWTFQVVESNRLGDSPPSLPSAPARPDVRPQKPGPPEVSHGDKQLQVKWKEPANEGSTITAYRITMRGHRTETREITASDAAFASRSYTWTGLSNGTSYSFAIEAKNSVEWSEMSGWSSEEHPSGPPSPPLNVRAVDVDGKSLSVTWSPPNNSNGDPIAHYVVKAEGTGGLGAASIIAGPDAREVQLTGLLGFRQTNYLVTVQAVTRGGSSVSAPFGPIGLKSAPSSVIGVTASGGDGSVTANFQAAAAGDDWQFVRLTPEINGILQHGQAVLATAGATTADVGAPNGTRVRIFIQACLSSDSGQVRCNPNGSYSGPVVPFGVPGAPDLGVGNAIPGTQSRNVRITRPLEGSELNGVPAGDISYWIKVGNESARQVTPGQEILVETRGSSVRVEAFVRDSRNNKQSKTTSTQVSPPLVVTKSNKKFTVSLVGWPTEGNSTCVVTEVKATSDTRPKPDANGVLPIHVSVSGGRGTGTGGPYEPISGKTAKITCQMTPGSDNTHPITVTVP